MSFSGRDEPVYLFFTAKLFFYFLMKDGTASASGAQQRIGSTKTNIPTYEREAKLLKLFWWVSFILRSIFFCKLFFQIYTIVRWKFQSISMIWYFFVTVICILLKIFTYFQLLFILFNQFPIQRWTCLQPVSFCG